MVADSGSLTTSSRSGRTSPAMSSFSNRRKRGASAGASGPTRRSRPTNRRDRIRQTARSSTTPLEHRLQPVRPRSRFSIRPEILLGASRAPIPRNRRKTPHRSPGTGSGRRKFSPLPPECIASCGIFTTRRRREPASAIRSRRSRSTPRHRRRRPGSWRERTPSG